MRISWLFSFSFPSSLVLLPFYIVVVMNQSNNKKLNFTTCRLTAKFWYGVLVPHDGRWRLPAFQSVPRSIQTVGWPIREG
jgi:hypothetical protein